MREQLNLFVTSPTPSDEWRVELPERSGAARYTHLIRAADDPKRISRSERKGNETRWRLDMRGSAEQWEDEMLVLLGDGRPRTFNRIVLELTDGRYTADVAFEGAPDTALWQLVERGSLEYRAQAPVLFRLSGP